MFAAFGTDPSLQPAGRASQPLYTAGAVALASWLGGVLGGCVIMSINDRRLGNESAARKTIAWGIGLPALEVFILLIIFNGTPPLPISGAINIVLIVLMGLIAKHIQGDAVEEHLQRGGERASFGTAFGISLLCFLGFIAIGFVVGFLWGVLKGATGHALVHTQDLFQLALGIMGRL